MCQGEPIPPPHLLLLAPQLLHSVLLTHWAMVEQLAGQWALRGPPEASEDKKGSSSRIYRECLGLGRAQGSTLLDEHMGEGA